MLPYSVGLIANVTHALSANWYSHPAKPIAHGNSKLDIR
jgi:hypothetical protein